MLRVTSLGKVVTLPAFYTTYQSKPCIYTVGYTVEVPVFQILGKDEKPISIAQQAYSSPDPSLLPWGSAQVTTAIEDLFLIISVGADNPLQPTYPVFSVVRSDDDKEASLKRVFTSKKNPNKAIRDALESIEQDYPDYKDKIHCNRDAKDGFALYGPRFLGVSLKPVQIAFQELSLGSLALQEAGEVLRCRNPASSSTSSVLPDTGTSKAGAIAVENERKVASVKGPSTRVSSRRSSPSTLPSSSSTPSQANTKSGTRNTSTRRGSVEEITILPMHSSTSSFICPDCGHGDTPFCAVTGAPHLPPTCPNCGLSSAYCPMTGKPHLGAIVREGRQRGEVQLPHSSSAPRKRRRKEETLLSSMQSFTTTPGAVPSSTGYPPASVAKGASSAMTTTPASGRRSRRKQNGGKDGTIVVVVDGKEDLKNEEEGEDLTVFQIVTQDGKHKGRSTHPPGKVVAKKRSGHEMGQTQTSKTGKSVRKKSEDSAVVWVDGEGGTKTPSQKMHTKEGKRTKRIPNAVDTTTSSGNSGTNKNVKGNEKDTSLLEFFENTSKQGLQKPLAALFHPPEVPTLRAPLEHTEQVRSNLCLTEKIKQKLQKIASPPLTQTGAAASSTSSKEAEMTDCPHSSSAPSSQRNVETRLSEEECDLTSGLPAEKDQTEALARAIKDSTAMFPSPPTGSLGGLVFLPTPFKEELNMPLVAVPTKRSITFPQTRGRGRGGRSGRGGGGRGPGEGGEENPHAVEKEQEGGTAEQSAPSSPVRGNASSVPPFGPQLVHPLDFSVQDSATVKRFISFSLQYASERSRVEALRASTRMSTSIPAPARAAKRKVSSRTVVVPMKILGEEMHEKKKEKSSTEQNGENLKGEETVSEAGPQNGDAHGPPFGTHTLVKIFSSLDASSAETCVS